MIAFSSYGNIPIDDEPFIEYLQRHIRYHGALTAFEDSTSGEKLTFQEVLSLVESFSIALQANGLRKGDKIGIVSANCVQYIPILIGAARCGIITTTCNPNFTKHEISRQFKHSGPAIIFVDNDAATKVLEISSSLPKLKKIKGVVYGCGEFDIFYLSYSLEFKAVKIDEARDTMTLLYSSGTTGLPKGVMSSYRSLKSCCLFCLRILRYNKEDALYTAVPLFHMYGIMGGWITLITGMRHVIEKRFSPMVFLDAVEKYKITRFHAVPPMVNVFYNNNQIHKYDLSSLKSIMCSAAPIAPDVAQAVGKLFKCKIAQLYGMTEMVPICIPDYDKNTPITAVGYIAANTTVKVVDERSGEILGPMSKGLLCIKGPQIMLGYYKNETATRQTIDSDGYLNTGDVGYYDIEGRLYVVDRMKDIIKYKGFQVAPAELESILLNHPNVQDAAVVGVKDFVAGELPMAYIVKKDINLTESEIHSYMKEMVSTYKQLSGGIKFVDDIPRSPSGKILRRLLRDSNPKL